MTKAAAVPDTDRTSPSVSEIVTIILSPTPM